MDITVRQAVSDKDFDTIVELYALNYGVDKVSIKSTLEENPRYELSFSMIAESNGSAIGTVWMFPTQLWLSGVPLQAVVISRAAVHPDFSGYDVVRSMVEFLLVKIASLGTAVSVVFRSPYDNIYLSLGFATVTDSHVYRFSPTQLRQFPTCKFVRPFGEKDDVAYVRSIYRGTQLSYADGRLSRQHGFWDYVTNEKFRVDNNYIMVYDDGVVGGYLKYKITSDDVLQVVEVLAVDEEAYQGLWGFVAKQSVSAVIYSAPTDGPVLDVLRPESFHDGILPYQVKEGFLLRVINPTESLISRFYEHNMMGNRVIKIRDQQLPANEEVIRFRIVDGRPDTLPVVSKDVDIDTDIATFSQIFCGYITPKKAHETFKLFVAGDETLLWFGRAMSSKPLYILADDVV
ncbi:MAG: hypothetical protein B6242_14635 [Anaerolineaceae bacterium 4572_78]|nr:MAG: hypothetical protein B6242_14635 [Anaerolineaceae bacterium 4572_78]